MNPLYSTHDSPIGPLLLISDGTSLTGLYMESQRHGPAVRPGWVREDDVAPFAEVRRQVDAYFAGGLTEFALPLAPLGTEFQQRVWQELSRIPYGETLTYGDVARSIGDPKAVRAVGLANGRNPLPLIVPCHRVIGAGGKLTGYGGGLDRKEALLAFEAAVRTRGPHPFEWPRQLGLWEGG
jgi:methylated-DNA-[protein]-cysteine S-methyltransferase